MRKQLLLSRLLPALGGVLLLGSCLAFGFSIDRARFLGGVLPEGLPPPGQLTGEEEILVGITTTNPFREEGGNPAANPSGSSGTEENKPLRGELLLGFYLREFPPSTAAFYRFEEAIDKHVDILRVFKAWGDSDRDFDPWLFLPLRSHRTIPLVSWEPWRRKEFLNQTEFNLTDIAVGRWDSYIRSWAQGVRRYEGPIFIEFGHEMNSIPGQRWWYPWQGDPEAYVAAFRHIVDIFREEGAGNAIWVWSPAKADQYAPLYYPGDEYVDWVGLTVLNFGVVPEKGRWETFPQLFDRQYQHLFSYGKPIILIEVSSAEQGGSKAEWIKGLFYTLEYRYPLVRAVVWFNNFRARTFPQIDWRIGSSPEAFDAFKEAIHRPFIGFQD